MLYPAIDTEQARVVDIVTYGEDPNEQMKELVTLYNKLTGNTVTAFDSIENAKKACVDAVHNRTFGRARRAQEQVPTVPVRPPWLNEKGEPTVYPPVQIADSDDHRGSRPNGPIARARVIFEEMWGSPRKDIIEACAKAGIKRSTASTQYQHFKKAKETATEHRNPENGMPQLPPGVQVDPQA